MLGLGALGGVKVIGAVLHTDAALEGLALISGTRPAMTAAANTPLGDAPPGRGRDVPGLAVDPADPNHVVEVDEDFTRGQCTFGVTFDGRRTWARGDLTAPDGLAPPTDPPTPPCDAFSSAGN